MDFLFFDKRPMFLFGTAIIFGAYIATGESIIQACILAALITAGAFAGKTNIKYIFIALLLGAGFFIYAHYYTEYLDNEYLHLDGKYCVINGKVISINKEKEEYTLATVKPDGYGNKKIKVYLLDNPYELIQGDKISFGGILHKPAPATNPGGYDARKIMYSDGIAAYIFAEAESVNINGGFTFGNIFGYIRKSIVDNCRKLLGEDRGSILAGMLIGDKTGLDPAVEDGFRDSGLSHTMAVSGAHVAYILAPLIFIFSKFGVERRKYYPWLLAVLLFFALLTGFQPSVARASLTAALMLIGGIISRETDSLNSLACSAVILIAANPFAIFDAGFILSYVCVIAILIFYKPLLAIIGKSPVARVLAITIAVQVGVFPATAKLFYSVQVFSTISNLLIFPVRALLAISGWIMYFISTICMPLARLFAVPVSILTDSIVEVASLFGSNSLSSVNVPFIPVWIIGLYSVSVYLVLHMKKHLLVPAAVASLAIMGYLMFFAVPVDTYVFFDSGQADCFLVKTDMGRDIIIDTGKYADCNSIAHFCGDYIDCIFITHAHIDHIGGLESILGRFRVGAVFVPGCGSAEMTGVRDMCTLAGVPCIELKAGTDMELDGYDISVLNPLDKDYLSLNDTSLVLKLTHGDKSLLYCGDIEMPAEIDLLAGGCDLAADIFKVPHHGAAGSAYKRFYEAVGPEAAIISCGENYFGHPSQDCMELLEGLPVYRTDQHGAIVIKAKKDGYKVTLCRRQIITE